MASLFCLPFEHTGLMNHFLDKMANLSISIGTDGPNLLFISQRFAVYRDLIPELLFKTLTQAS